jgi:predicted phosphohydrolase
MADDSAKTRFLDHLRRAHYDALLLTGDISNAKQLVGHLEEISRACAGRSVFFTLGNHDYFFGTMREVDRSVAELCKRNRNLIQLGQGEIIELSSNTALVGHRGWYDGRAGYGLKTRVTSPDHKWINDFRHLTKRKFFDRMRELGEDSADYFRQVLPEALDRYRKVLVGTHVPPCYQALKFSDHHCRWERQPYYANCSAGEVIIGISRDYPAGKITVHAGHCHSKARVAISQNLEVQVLAAKTGKPELKEILLIE